MINLDKFQDFMDGDRLVMLTLRSKDGGTNNPDRAAKKKISHSKEDFIRIVNEFDSIRKTDERIYSSVNKRSINIFTASNILYQCLISIVLYLFFFKF